jgi:asparagine synthase (glutamine-hydrolysing)
MIYGSINSKENLPHLVGRLENIGKILNWNGCIPEFFSRDAFSGVYLASKNIFLQKEDVFFEDQKSGFIVFLDGFIYNFKELTLLLDVPQKDIKTPELVLLAYLKWGKFFAEHLNGDFAICIYSKTKNQTLFYVDHLGIRPLAITVIESTLFFATDVMGLSKALFNKDKINPDFLINFFLRSGRDYLATPDKSIIRIKPGHFYQFSTEGQEEKRYWFPEKIKTDATLTIKQILKDLRFLLTDSVNIRADKRFNASAHLSGGIDSGIVSIIARKAYSYQEEFYGFSWSPKPDNTEQNINDERSRVLEICKRNSMIPFFSNYSLREYFDFISEWRYPSELLFEKNIVAAAKTKGVNLIFSGWGGDEFLSIGNRAIDADMLKNFDWKHFLKKFPVWRIRKCIKALQFEILEYNNRKNYSKQKAVPFVYRYIKTAIKSNRIPTKKRFKYNSRRAVHLQLIGMNHLAARTADWYVNGQINGIEYRYPLLDKRIVEYMLKVPSKFLVNGYEERILIKKLGEEFLPKDILARLSKSDTANLEAFSTIAQDAQKQFVKDLKIFRSNPDLFFVDFIKVESDLPRMLTTSKNEKPLPANVLHAIKKAHEFTIGYYRSF